MRKFLAPVHPNAGLEAAYRRKLDRMIDAMNKSIDYWLKAAYRANEPEIAQDELPAAALQKVMRRLARYWNRKFDQAAPQLAEYFATQASERVDGRLKQILKDGGFSVPFRVTPAMRDVMKAVVHENVSLIKSIPQQHLLAVEGSVMRSVQAGRDLKALSDDLRQHFGVTKRRAALISRDQNQKATAMLSRARQLELGIKQAVWMHSGAGKEPRPSHLKAGREQTVFDLNKGWFDPHEGKWILPGQLIGCRCTSRPVIPGIGIR